VGGGSGVTANLNDAGPIGLPASYSIFSDSTNAANVNPVGSVGNVTPSQTPVIGQYCNGARIPPEQCTTGQGANDPGMCKGYFTPAGQSETVGVAPVFVFNGIAASATVDEGNNWINLTYGPLTLGRPPANGSGSTPSAEPTVASAAVGIAQGAYSIMAGSAAVGAGNAAAPGTPNHDFYGQTRSTSGVSIGAVEFAVPAPTLTAITPNSGVQGTTVSVTLTGTNFTAGSNVVITPSTGITQSGATFSATSITTSFQIAGNAPTTARTVTVGTSGGTTAGVTFTVIAKPPAPTLTSITPNTGTRGNTVAVTLVGSNFSSAGLGVNVSGSGVTATNVTFVDATHVTANLVIDPSASLNNGGARNVTVTTAGGTSGSRTFTISNPPTATLTSISPTSGTHGTTVTVTLTGTNFTTAGTSINVGDGITPTITSLTPTQIVASFVIPSTAVPGTQFVNVTTPRNTTATRTFTVN
jgi:hypothetical protein